MGATLEVLCGLGQRGIAHQVLTILELAALLQEALGVGLRCSYRVGVGVLVDGSTHLWQVIPIDLELGDAGLLGEDVPVKAGDHGRSGRVLVELGAVVLDVHVVADAEELLAILVGAGEEDGGDADDVSDGKVAVVGCISLFDTRNTK